MFPARVGLTALLDYGIPLSAGAVAPAAVPVPVPVPPIVDLGTALTEEVGWTTCLTDRLLPRLGTTGTGLVLDVIRALWHVVPYLQAVAASDQSRARSWPRWPRVSASSRCTHGRASGCPPRWPCTPPSNSQSQHCRAGPDLDPAAVTDVLTVAAAIAKILRTWETRHPPVDRKVL